MAIKIDLLPGYVKLRRNLHRTIAGCIVATCLVLSGLMLQLKKRQLELRTAEQNRDAMLVAAGKATAAEEAARVALEKAAPAEGAVKFMTAVSKTGAQRAALLDMVRDSINAETIVKKIDISDGKTVTIEATVRTPDEYARFLLNLRRNSATQGGVLFAQNPTAAGPGGFANGAAPFVMPTSPTGEAVPIVYPINVVAQGTLLNPVEIPPDPTGGAAATTGATAGATSGSSPMLPPPTAG